MNGKKMFAATIAMFLFVVFSLIVSTITAEPMERIKKDQPDYYKSFGMSLIPFSPSRIAFTLFLVLGEYKKNVKCPVTVQQLAKARAFAVMQLLAFIMFFLIVFVNWKNY